MNNIEPQFSKGDCIDNTITDEKYKIRNIRYDKTLADIVYQVQHYRFKFNMSDIPESVILRNIERNRMKVEK